MLSRQYVRVYMRGIITFWNPTSIAHEIYTHNLSVSHVCRTSVEPIRLYVPNRFLSRNSRTREAQKTKQHFPGQDRE